MDITPSELSREKSNHAPMYLALVLAVVGHSLAVVFFPSLTHKSFTLRQEQTIEIVLLAPTDGESAALNVFKLHDTDVSEDQPVEQMIERENAREAQEENRLPSTRIPESNSRLENPASPDNQRKISARQLRRQVNSVISTLLQSEPRQTEPRHTERRTFTVQDMPRKKELANARDWIERLVITPKRFKSAKIGGQLTYQVQGVFGRPSCLQQRGNPADESSWQWHRVPESVCRYLEAD